MIRAALVGCAVLLSVPAVAAPKSFVVVTLDDVNWHLFNAAMTETMAVPGATVFPRAFTNIPLCGPSRAAFLTGQEGETTGLTSNDPSDWGAGFMPEALRDAGYRTMMIGKVPNNFAGSPADLGFQQWAVLADPDGGRYFSPDLDVNGSTKRVNGYTSDDFYRRGRNCVEGSRPFFCWIAALGAHSPATARPGLVNACAAVPFEPGPAFNEADMADKPSWMQGLEAFRLGKQANIAEGFREQCDTLKADDEGVRSILDIVARDRHVCVIVTADNGRLHGQHRLTGKSALYEESINVPLATWNCDTESGVDERLVSNVDLPAHMLASAGVQPLRRLDGRTLSGAERSRVRIVGGTDIDATGWRRQSNVEWTYGNGEIESYDLAPDPYQESSRKKLRRPRK